MRQSSLRRFPFLPVSVAALVAAVAVAACGRAGESLPTVIGPFDSVAALPPPLDLRFKGVGKFSAGVDLEHTVTLGSSGSLLDFFFYGAAGSPLEIGTGLCAPGSCGWPFDVYALPRGLPWVETAYLPGLLAELPAVLDTAPSDTLIMSLDVEPAESLYATAVFIVPDSRGYRLTSGVVPLAGLQAAATAEAAQRRVITALAFDSGSVRYLSYAWRYDSAAGYEAKVATATFTGLGPAAQALGAGGYVVTAFGGDSADGFVLVGTRVRGDSTPRAVLVNPSQDLNLAGYAPVAYALEAPPGTSWLVVEK